VRSRGVNITKYIIDIAIATGIQEFTQEPFGSKMIKLIKTVKV
jgi:hypothetical protein